MAIVAIGSDAISRELNLYLVVLLLLLQLAWDETFSFGSASYSGCLVMPDLKLPDIEVFCSSRDQNIDDGRKIKN